EPASTGPRSFNRGRGATVGAMRRSTATLQRGRGLSTAEGRTANGPGRRHEAASTGPRSFNRGRGHGSGDGSGKGCGCFNGAAVFQPRKGRRGTFAARSD